MSDLRAGFPSPPSLNRWVSDAEVAEVLGGPPERAELLTHNPYNAVTGGIWRVAANGNVAVCKVLTDGRDHDGPDWWTASPDPTHWNYWRREADVYIQDLAQWFRPDGIDAPRLLAVPCPGSGAQAPVAGHRTEDGTVVLWLAWEDGTPGPQLGIDGLAAFVEALGRTQGRLADGGPDAAVRAATPWLSRGFLADYADSKPVDEARLADDRAWAAPRVAHHLGRWRDDLRRLHHDRGRFYAMAARCPRTLCHLDVWPANLARRHDGTFVLFDWAFCGDGALGEDIANLIPDAIFDLLYPTEDLEDITHAVEAAYLVGLREGGWDGDERWVRLGMRAAAAKYHWLVGSLLPDPDADTGGGSSGGDNRDSDNDGGDDDQRQVYGGRMVPAEDLYATRAAGLGLLCRWADEARALAAELGL